MHLGTTHREDVLPFYSPNKLSIPSASFKRKRGLFACFVALICFVLLTLWSRHIYDKHVSIAQTLSPVRYPADSSTKPLSLLGLEADQAYHLGSLSPSVYQRTLQTFIDTASLPSRLKTRLSNDLHQFLAFGSSGPLLGPPKNIWQTNDVRPLNSETMSWETLNPDRKFRFLNDEDAEEWVRRTFTDSLVEQVWNALPHVIMKSDFLRYLLLLVEGGVYSDMDTTCLKPIDVWGSDADVMGHMRGDDSPSAIVGIEADVGDRADWHDWWSRPIQIVQWTMAFSPGHPILLDVVERICNRTLEAEHTWGPLTVIPEERMTKTVLEWTGPAVFTDATLRFLQMESGINWTDLKNLQKPLRVGSITVLPVTGFSPGVGNFGAGATSDPQAMASYALDRLHSV
ncbi:nucleotide-diphospho-sugar transferase [Hysterangium stoloniferum]|nr:nucleotide-diphospho-sugar transferase [Hysterangium stoloniferum]